jgi:hypothetical protein
MPISNRTVTKAVAAYYGVRPEETKHMGAGVRQDMMRAIDAVFGDLTVMELKGLLEQRQRAIRSDE